MGLYFSFKFQYLLIEYNVLNMLPWDMNLSGRFKFSHCSFFNY